MTAGQRCEGCGSALARIGSGEWACPRSRCPRYLDAAPGAAVVLNFDELARWRPVQRLAKKQDKRWWRA